MRILGVPGSLRDASLNRQLLELAAEQMKGEAELVIFDEIEDLPLFNAELETDPPDPSVARWVQALQEADAVLIASPEYNGSITAALKNALDWASRPNDDAPLDGHLVAVMGASPSSRGAAGGQQVTREVAERIGAEVLDAELLVGRAPKVIEDGDLVDHELQGQLEALVGALLKATAKRLGTDGPS